MIYRKERSDDSMTKLPIQNNGLFADMDQRGSFQYPEDEEPVDVKVPAEYSLSDIQLVDESEGGADG